MLRLLVLGLAATLASASPLLDVSVGGALLQGNFKIGSAQTGLFSAISVDQVVEKYLKSVKDEANLEKLFEEFKQLYKKEYTSADHEKSSKDLFLERVLMVLENNIKALHHQSSFTQTLHAGSDLPIEDILMQPAGNWPTSGSFYDNSNTVNVSESQYVSSWVIDLRTQHQVTDVVNQGGCGACVYFAASACIESFWARKGHGLVHLSPQQLNDCARNEARGNHDCNHGGGTFVPTFDYIKAHGLTATSNYPYLAKGEGCKKDQESRPVARISNWHPVLPHNDEMALEKAVHDHGAIAVAVHVNDAFAHYKSGILDVECKGGRNHAVLVVGLGYDEASNRDYWLIKNQWGSGWGEHGFMKLRRKHGNMCDVAGDAVYVE